MNDGRLSVVTPLLFRNPRLLKKVHDLSTETNLMNDKIKSQSLQLPGVAIIGTAFGAMAIGAFAVGTLAIGRLAIRRLFVNRVKFKSLEIEELIVRRIHADEVVIHDSLRLPRKTGED